MHKLRSSAAASICIGVLVLIAGAERGASAPRSPAAHRIVIANLAFGASPPDIRVGDTVEWVNQDIFRHTATAGDKSFDLDIPAGARAAFVPGHAGRFDYICKYHPGMKGALVVSP